MHCPCGSGARYAACCKPLHRGAEPPTAEALMRSRFAAYALGEVEYLYRTLDPGHPDRTRPAAEHAAQVRAARRTLRYIGLRVLAHEEAPGSGIARVLFHAELYEAGQERSFIELSEFRRYPEGWRYHSGALAAAKAGDPRIAGVGFRDFSERFPEAE